MPAQPLHENALIPRPASVQGAEGAFPLSCDSTFGSAALVQELAADLQQILACEDPVKMDASEPDIDVRQGYTGPPESYQLKITPARVLLRGSDAAGVAFGVQTLRQLIVPGTSDTVLALAAGVIEDGPAWAWRGLMLDVARHFFTVDEVKRIMDLAAAYKINRFHLHLTDDQGWRIQIDSWPKLTEIGAATQVDGAPSGFYTKADYKALVDHAASLHMVLVPEIDMPGHINAALASYGELNCDGKPAEPYIGTSVGISSLCLGAQAVTDFVTDVIREIVEMTPGAYIHLGTDEPYETDHDLYAGFVSEAFDLVRSHGKQVIGWEEAAETGQGDEWTVQQWLIPERIVPAVEAGAKAILSPYGQTYLSMAYTPDVPVGNVWAGRTDIERVYDWDPATWIAGVPAASILGVEAAVWTERVRSLDEIEFTLFPRLLAYAEVAWGTGNRDAAGFRARVAAHQPRLDQLGINYYRAPDVDWID